MGYIYIYIYIYIWAGVCLVNRLIYIIYTFIDAHMSIYDKKTIVSHFKDRIIGMCKSISPQMTDD